MSDQSHYGQFYWCIKTPLSENGEIYAFADRVVIDRGALALIGRNDLPMLIIAAGGWLACYAASVMDGSAVAVEIWEGEVIR